MATDIVVKNPSPRNGDDAIPRTSVISFILFPFNGASINLSTLSMKLIINGGPTNITQQRIYTSSSTGVTVSGSSTSGYKIKVDPFPGEPSKFESNERVELRIDVDDNSGNSMRTTSLKYMVVDAEQYDAISDLLNEITEITVEYEQGRINSDKQTVDFTYGNWSLTKTPKVYKNGIDVNTSLYTTDLVAGKIFFSDQLRNGEIIDMINADYFFSALGEDQIINCMRIALSEFNAFRPQTSYTLRNAPSYVMGAIMIGGAGLAIQSLLNGFPNQQSRIKWGEEWDKLIPILQKNADSYKEVSLKLFEEKRYKLASPLAITIPEYTLPGGRSRFFRYLYKEGGGM